MYGLIKIASEHEDELAYLLRNKRFMEAAYKSSKNKLQRDRAEVASRGVMPGMVGGWAGGALLGAAAQKKFPKFPGVIVGSTIGTAGGGLAGDRIAGKRFEEENENRYRGLDSLKRSVHLNDDRIRELQAQQN